MYNEILAMSSILFQWQSPPHQKAKLLILVESQTDRFCKAGILRTSLHIEGLDLYRKSTQQDGLINGVRHQSLRSFWDILRLNKTSLTFTTQKATRQKQLSPTAALHVINVTQQRPHTHPQPKHMVEATLSSKNNKDILTTHTQLLNQLQEDLLPFTVDQEPSA